MKKQIVTAMVMSVVLGSFMGAPRAEAQVLGVIARVTWQGLLVGGRWLLTTPGGTATLTVVSALVAERFAHATPGQGDTPVVMTPGLTAALADAEKRGEKTLRVQVCVTPDGIIAYPAHAQYKVCPDGSLPQEIVHTMP